MMSVWPQDVSIGEMLTPLWPCAHLLPGRNTGKGVTSLPQFSLGLFGLLLFATGSDHIGERIRDWPTLKETPVARGL